MADSSATPKSVPLKALVLIALVVGSAALAFAYTAGWLSPHRLTPDKLVSALLPPGGPALGHRRNHAKGICFTGIFEANGEGTALSAAQVFARGEYPVVGRFNLAGSDLHMPDPMAQVRGFSVRIATPDGQEWRSAMLDAPVFAAPTPRAFYQFLKAAGSNDPGAMKPYVDAHPEILDFIALMIGMPLIGWAMLSAEPYPVKLFGTVQLPAIAPASPELHARLWTAHHYLALAFFALILVHLAAALFHRWVRHDGVFEAMAPGAQIDSTRLAK
jgi:hypothetical protein